MTLWPLWSSDGACTCVYEDVGGGGGGEEICTWRATHTHIHTYHRRIIRTYLLPLPPSFTSQHTCRAACIIQGIFLRITSPALNEGYIGVGGEEGERERDGSLARARAHRDPTNWPSNRARHTWKRRSGGEGKGRGKDVCFSNGRNRWIYARRCIRKSELVVGSADFSLAIYRSLVPTRETHSRRGESSSSSPGKRRLSIPRSGVSIGTLRPSRWHLANFHVSRARRWRMHTYSHMRIHTHTSRNRAGRSLTCRANRRIRSDS